MWVVLNYVLVFFRYLVRLRRGALAAWSGRGRAGPPRWPPRPPRPPDWRRSPDNGSSGPGYNIYTYMYIPITETVIITVTYIKLVYRILVLIERILYSSITLPSLHINTIQYIHNLKLIFFLFIFYSHYDVDFLENYITLFKDKQLYWNNVKKKYLLIK